MNFFECMRLIKADCYRLGGKDSLGEILKQYILGNGFRYNFWFRLGTYSKSKKHLKFTFFIFVRYMLRRWSHKLGIDIPAETNIDKGFYIGHFGAIVISSAAIIGKNFNISQGVTIGVAGFGEKRGVPIIGENVYIGPGAKVFGKITIGNNVAIGANVVVTKNVPDNAVVAGVPAKIINMNSSKRFIKRNIK